MINNRLKKIESFLSQEQEAKSVVMVIKFGDNPFHSKDEEMEYIRCIRNPVVEIDREKVEKWRLSNKCK